MQQLPDDVDSTFRYILIAAKRAEQLIEGARPRIALGRHAKPATIALAELNEDAVPWQRLTAAEFEALREQALGEDETAEDVLAGVQLPSPPEPPVEEPEAETDEEGEEFSDDDLGDADFDEDIEDLEDAEDEDLLEDDEASAD
jgi:DNA-directed RNA polymerase omega subunit